MPVGVCAVRSEMVVSVGMRDRMRVDVAAVEMREGVLVRMGVVPHERGDVDGVENRRQKCVEYRFQGIAPIPCRMPAMPVAATSLQILPSASNE